MNAIHSFIATLHNNPEHLNPQYQRCGNLKSLSDATKLFSTQFRLTVHKYSDTGASKELILGLRIRVDFTGALFVLIVGARRNMTVSVCSATLKVE